MKNNRSVTLIELIIAMSLLTLVILAGSGIYLSGWNIFRDAQAITQAQRNAMVPMAHIVKTMMQGAGFVQSMAVEPPEHPEYSITFETYNTPQELFTGPTLPNYFSFDPDTHQIIYSNTNMASPLIIGVHIHNCAFEPDFNHSETIVNITITARDNNNNPGSEYTTQSRVLQRYMQIPPIY